MYLRSNIVILKLFIVFNILTHLRFILQDRYVELYTEKHGTIIQLDNLPPFDREIWDIVQSERDVGPNRKQALGGLPVRGCTMDNNSSSTKKSCYAGSSYRDPQPSQPNNISEELVAQLTQNIVAAVTTSVTASLGPKIDQVLQKKRRKIR